MRRIITRDDLAALIDTDKLRSIVDEKVAAVTSLTRQKEDTQMKSLARFIKGVIAFAAIAALVCGIAYAVYKYLVPDYDDEFDDEFDDAFDDDDLFDDDDIDDDADEKKDDTKAEKDDKK